MIARSQIVVNSGILTKISTRIPDN